MKEIKKLTFEAACKMKKLDAKKVIPDFAGFPAKDRKAMKAHAKCVIMVAAANQIANGGKPWHPDYKNTSERQYTALWYYKGGSAGFRYSRYDYWVTTSSVGSRLEFFSYETMVALCEANRHYIKFWNEYAL